MDVETGTRPSGGALSVEEMILYCETAVCLPRTFLSSQLDRKLYTSLFLERASSPSTFSNWVFLRGQLARPILIDLESRVQLLYDRTVSVESRLLRVMQRVTELLRAVDSLSNEQSAAAEYVSAIASVSQLRGRLLKQFAITWAQMTARNVEGGDEFRSLACALTHDAPESPERGCACARGRTPTQLARTLG